MGGIPLTVVVAVTALSLFYRSCLGVIAPELTRDLGLTPEDLGRANGAFFLSMAAMQIPVGLLFDRYGPRRVVASLTVLAVVAAALHGMDGPSRGNVLLAMAAAQLLGILAFGPLDRIFDTRKWIIVPGGLCTVGLLGALALVPGLPVTAAVALLILFTGVTSYAVVIVAHGRSLFPDHLLGRGVTTVNIAQVVGLTVLPLITGPIVGAFPAPGAASPEIAYRAAFGAIALLLAAGLAIYGAKARDARPSSTQER